MDCPELYIRQNGLQRTAVQDILNGCADKMVWKPDEVVLDVGCGPGDVTSDILFCSLQNKFKQLVGVDKSRNMVEYAKGAYGCSKMDFKVLDVENAEDCAAFRPRGVNKIFSFFCFHWINNKFDALVNMRSLLESGGDILVHFMLINPVTELYKDMDKEWHKYIEKIKQRRTTTFRSQEEVKDMFIKAGFRVINIQLSVKKHTFPDLTALLNAVKPVDDMYTVLPSQLHDKYFKHVRDKVCKSQMVDICPDTGKTTTKYLPITVHATKN